MLQPVLRRSALVFVLAAFAFAAGALSATLMAPREAHAQTLSSSTILVPQEGLTFRSVDGRAIARLSYDSRGGVFEVLGDHGNAVASMRQQGRPGVGPVGGPTTEWSVDDVPDPWTPASGL